MQVTTMGGNTYFLTFIVVYTRMRWVYFLTCKSEVFGDLKRFKAMIELWSRYALQKLRSDRGRIVRFK